MEKTMYILVFFMIFSYTLVTKESKKIFHQEASMNLDIHICPTNLLTQKQLQEIADLTTFCHRHAGIELSYPVEEEHLTRFLSDAYFLRRNPGGMLRLHPPGFSQTGILFPAS